jgi:hypothetical protein
LFPQQQYFICSSSVSKHEQAPIRGLRGGVKYSSGKMPVRSFVSVEAKVITFIHQALVSSPTWTWNCARPGDTWHLLSCRSICPKKQPGKDGQAAVG